MSKKLILGMGKTPVIRKSISDFSTTFDEEEAFLTSRMFPVIMRLFNSSTGYRDLILRTLDCMMEVAGCKYDDYDEIKGISGANVGVPFNLVVIKMNRIDETIPEGFENLVTRKWLRYYLNMINPKIVAGSKRMVTHSSNCGSLVLKDPIKVKRHEWVTVVFYDRNGNKRHMKFKRPYAGTIQHEIDHNAGVLITDRATTELEE